MGPDTHITGRMGGAGKREPQSQQQKPRGSLLELCDERINPHQPLGASPEFFDFFVNSFAFPPAVLNNIGHGEIPILFEYSVLCFLAEAPGQRVLLAQMVFDSDWLAHHIVIGLLGIKS